MGFPMLFYVYFMFFFLSKVLYYLVMPLTWVILLIIVSFFVKRKKFRKSLQILGFTLFLFISNPFLSNLIQRQWEVKPSHLTGKIKTAVVLSGMINYEIDIPNQIQLNQHADRIIETIRLYHKGMIEEIIISGGSGSILFPENVESETLKVIAMDLGVKESDIRIDTQSNNTYENAIFTKALLRPDEQILLITSSSHMRRAVACFRKQQINFVSYPVDYRAQGIRFTPEQFIPSPTAITTWHSIVKEWIGFVVYKLMGHI